MSKEKILAALRHNQPEISALPVNLAFERDESINLVEKFRVIAEGIGSKVYVVAGLEEVAALIAADFPEAKRVLSTVAEVVSSAIPAFELHEDPHTYADVDIAIFKPRLAVAENSALWITEDRMGVRALPFITQHIIMLVDKNTLVPDMHAAYEKIGDTDYGFSTFIAGPSKTADIEQSLVLGAHGPRSMTIFMH
ncbi:LUD domain-containing protein [Pedobacter sp. L105]|uniref:LutC/YkgG family protein n=1 Tax=Pedobacter sp. L105 TaxID=1641871 RepID=UPI00131DA4DD|nr:LUD domain-containing protein [Pedobacter sp. L105]